MRRERFAAEIGYSSKNYRTCWPFWRGARDWARQRKALSAREDGILEAAGGMRGSGLVSEKQAVIAMEVLRRMEDEGFRR